MEKFTEMDNPEISSWVENLIKTLKEKELQILNKNAEIEALNALISLYREQFDLDNYPYELSELKKSYEKLEINLSNKSIEYEEYRSKTDFLLEDYQIKLSNKDIELDALKIEHTKKIEEIRRENKQAIHENKLIKSQLTALESKNSIFQQLTDGLKKDKEKLEGIIKENEEKFEKLTSQLNSKEIQPKLSYQLAHSDELLLDEELERFQRDLEGFEALNVNIQGSLNQFQVVLNPATQRFSRNLLTSSRSIDISKNFMQSPRTPSNIAKNPSFSFIYQNKNSMGFYEGHKDLISKLEINEAKYCQEEETVKPENIDHNRQSYWNTNPNNTINAFEIINEEDKDQDFDVLEKNHHKELLKLDINPISQKSAEIQKTRKIKQKCKSLINLQNFSENEEQQKLKKRTKSLVLCDKAIDPNHFKEMLSLENLENDCFGLLKMLIDGVLNLFKDFQNKISSHCKRINKNLAEINDFANNYYKEYINNENFNVFLKKQKFFNSEITEYYKDYLLNASEMIKFLNEQNLLLQTAQHICEGQETLLHDKEIELKNKLEEIVKLHQNIIDYEKKEISFEENINEIYEKNMLMIEEKDIDEWKKLDRFKKFTNIIEGLVKKKLKIQEQNRDIKEMEKNIEDMEKKTKEMHRENIKKNEALIRGESREKSIKKDRDFFYSQLMFFKKKVLEQGIFEVDVESLMGEVSKYNEKDLNFTDFQKFLNKFKNFNFSVKTLVENLITYDENKNKEITI